MMATIARPTQASSGNPPFLRRWQPARRKECVLVTGQCFHSKRAANAQNATSSNGTKPTAIAAAAAITFGDYWLLEARDRGAAKARAAFIEWFNLEAKSCSAPSIRITAVSLQRIKYNEPASPTIRSKKSNRM